jgi:hypothetical protein
VPAHAFDIAELMELTPALETAAVDHGTSLEASEAGPYTTALETAGSCRVPMTSCPGC